MDDFAALGVHLDAPLNSAWQAAARRHSTGVLACSGSAPTAPSAPVNLLKDPGFDGPGIGDWSLRPYKVGRPGSAEISISPGGRNGDSALKIPSSSPADVGASGVEIPVTTNTRYRFRGWIRTENFRNTGGRGAITPISPPSGPDHWLFQRPPAESKLLAALHRFASADQASLSCTAPPT